MVLWILALVALGLFVLMTMRERYVDTPGPGPRPSMNDASWRSKVDAQASIGDSDEDYMAALQKFYDEIYAPLRRTNATAAPKDTQVEAFLTSNTPPGLSKDALRQMILSGFAVDRTESAAAREKRQIKFEPSEALEPRDGVDQVYGRRKEDIYTPANPVADIRFPEGPYLPTSQTEPLNEGSWDDNTTSWSSAQFASVCPCAQNVL